MYVSLRKRNKAMKKLWMILLATMLLAGCSTQKKVTPHQIGSFHYKRIADFSPYSESTRGTPYQDSVSAVYWKNSDNPTPIRKQLVAGIDKLHIIKHGEKESVEAIVYLDNRYDKGYNGISVAFSSDNGKTWDYYYTGLTQSDPLFVKWHSKYPLIDDEGNIQIEACMTKWVSSPLFSNPGYKVTKDGLLLTIDMETLRMDSDGDGLTDIEETKLRTDSHNVDTDNDGIPDNLDLNPRCNVPRTEKTIVYEAIINDEPESHYYSEKDSFLFLPFDKKDEPNFATDTTPTVMILTDDLDIMGVQPKNVRVIFLTSEEYEKTKDQFRNDLRQRNIITVKQENGGFKVVKSELNWGTDYQVKKTEDGWVVEVVSIWIS